MSVRNLIQGRFPLGYLINKVFRSAGLWVLILAVTVSSVFFYVRSNPSEEHEFLGRFRGGTLLIAGGGEMPPIVNQRFWELAGGKRGLLVIIPAYEATREDTKRLKEEWRGWKFASMRVIQAGNRDVADEPCFSDPISKATAVWFSGGEQSWLANLYAGTETETRLQELLDRGGVIGGTSAGAAIMTKVMIEEGKSTPKLRRGLDLLKDSVVDQHFFRRNRMQRLAKTLRIEPALIGFGVDEGTAMVVHVSSGRIGVLGKSYVMACIPEIDSDSLRMEVLMPGTTVDMDGLRGVEAIVDDETEPT
ncbi:MAG: cyanophycinase [Planctomycetota bacterium]|nr:cyanophycinase [Planctomycetota bacterium]